jgi:NADH-quinone oxidoreductase subunit C
MNDVAKTVEQIYARFPEAIIEVTTFRDETTLVLHPEYLVAVATFLHDDPAEQFTFLADITAVDWLEREPRYDVVYHLLSMPYRKVLRLKVRVGEPGEEHPEVPTVTGVWPAANWFEREVYDLFGIVFTGHPDLRRILMPSDWSGHPLRKDYPLTGFTLPEPHWGGQVLYEEAENQPQPASSPPPSAQQR